MPTGRKKPDTLNVPSGAPMRYSQIQKQASQGNSGSDEIEHKNNPSFSGHQGDILRLRQQQPSAARRRDIPYFRNSAVSSKNGTSDKEGKLTKTEESNPFTLAIDSSNKNQPANNSGNSSTTQATQATSTVTLERSRTQDFFKYGGAQTLANK